jgi:hypothetical protein
MTNEELDHARATKAVRLRFLLGLHQHETVIAARLAREGWTPPVAVDPDIAEVADIFVVHSKNPTGGWIADFGFACLKRGRELERAEAKPGMVWVKHDGSGKCPAPLGACVTTRVKNGSYIYYSTQTPTESNWPSVTHYAIIAQPEEK